MTLIDNNCPTFLEHTHVVQQSDSHTKVNMLSLNLMFDLKTLFQKWQLKLKAAIHVWAKQMLCNA